MDTSPGEERRPGGKVEPDCHGPLAKPLTPQPQPRVAERYELRDPFAEVTYRLARLDEMIAKAEELGATRFSAVAPDGRRTLIFKAAGRWTRPDEPRVQNQPTPRESQQHVPVPLTRVVAPVPIEPSIEKPTPDADREARVAQLEAALNERYIIKRAAIRIGDVTIGQTEYRHRGDVTKVAFTESAFRLATDTNSPSVARSMVDVAEARNWKTLRVSGHEDFKRLVWLEASLRDVKTVGYDPVPGDHELLRKEREARQVNRMEPGQASAAAAANAPATKSSSRGSGSRKTVLVALEAILIAQRVPTKQREAVMAAAEENLAQRIRNGETHRVKVYDKTAPSQREIPAPTREVQRNRERPAPTR